MSEQRRVVVCQRCGFGFVLTESYLGFLVRWGARVVEPIQCPRCFWTSGAIPKESGTIKWFSARKHYGFIIRDDGDEIFFHQRQIVGDGLIEAGGGQSVRFHLSGPYWRPEALNVELVREPEPSWTEERTCDV